MHLLLKVVIFIFINSTASINCLNFCTNNDNNVTSYYQDSKIQNCCANLINKQCTIRKCCKFGYYFGGNGTCRTNYNKEFKFPIYKKAYLSRIVDGSKEPFLVGLLKCSTSKYVLLPEPFRPQEDDGSIWLPKEDRYYYNNDYCLDERNGRYYPIICEETDSPETLASIKINTSGMIISMPFLFVTFLVYALLPDRNLHQMALMFYVLALLLSYIFLVTINLKGDFGHPECTIFGYLTYFCFMVSFFWMNVICFDIWYTFSGGRGFLGSNRASERKKLLIYSTYAFGVPLLLIILTLSLQLKLSKNSSYSPGIGDGKCFIRDGWPVLLYFYLEAAILVVANITFFAITAIKIRKIKKETSVLKHTDSQKHNLEKDKQKFNLYVKLLVAMGVNWSMEVISFVVNYYTDYQSQYIFYATDFFNAVYGVFIFFIFVFKKKVWTLLQRRYYIFTGRPHLAHTVAGITTRTSHYSTTENTSSGWTNHRPPHEELPLRRVT